jgi:large subunit ribosomal protein L10
MKTREQKQQDLNALSEQLNNATSAMVVSFSKVTVNKDQEFRNSLREAGAKYQVVKNTLARLAVKGTQYEAASEYFKGVTAIAWTDSDPVVLSKAIAKFVKDNADIYTFKAGVVDGRVVTLEDVKSIASLPSKEELISQLLFVLNAQAQRIVTVINAVPRDLAIVIKQIGDKIPVEAAVEAPVEAAPAQEAAPAVEEATAAEEAPAVEAAADETPAQEAAPAVEEAVEAAPAEEAAPAVEEAPAAEEAPAVEEAAADESPAQEAAPVAEETPAVEETVEAAPAEEAAPAQEAAPAAEETPTVEAAADESPAQEAAPVPEETPAVEETVEAAPAEAAEAPAEEAAPADDAPVEAEAAAPEAEAEGAPAAEDATAADADDEEKKAE